MNGIRHLGAWSIIILGSLGRAGMFLGQVLLSVPVAVGRLRLLIQQVFSVGVLTLIIVVVSGLFVGMVLGLQGYNTLVDFGAESSLGLVVALSLTRELGPVLTALILAGRIGASVRDGP